MKRILNFLTRIKNDSTGEKKDLCFGQTYYDFLDYAFSISDFFMLVYINNNGDEYSKIQKAFIRELSPYEVKQRTNPSWPGTKFTQSLYPEYELKYKIVFYRNDEKAKEILKKVDSINCWAPPNYPEDIAFFKGNKCRIETTIHEGIGAVLYATDEDIDFFTKYDMTKRVKWDDNGFYDYCDEELI